MYIRTLRKSEVESRLSSWVEDLISHSLLPSSHSLCMYFKEMARGAHAQSFLLSFGSIMPYLSNAASTTAIEQLKETCANPKSPCVGTTVFGNQVVVSVALKTFSFDEKTFPLNELATILSSYFGEIILEIKSSEISFKKDILTQETLDRVDLAFHLVNLRKHLPIPTTRRQIGF